MILEEERLFLQPECGPKREILPESESEFFVEGDVVHMTFVRDEAAKGSIDAMLVFRNGSRVGERAERVE